MARYIVLINWTDQGLRNVKTAPQRAQAAHRAIEAADGRMTLFFTMGQYDQVAILEAPDDETASRLAFGAAGGGNSRTVTLKAFTEEEFAGIASKMPSPAV